MGGLKKWMLFGYGSHNNKTFENWWHVKLLYNIQMCHTQMKVWMDVISENFQHSKVYWLYFKFVPICVSLRSYSC
jgi:hypothetical protein